MDEKQAVSFNIYDDIKARTNGDIYIGVVGPVRCGKSTFIKRFMDLCVIPKIEDENVRSRTVDELPQSGNGKLVMTTEPKFVPKDSVRIELHSGCPVNIRLIDCVGFMVEGAGITDGEDKERMVQTPWSDEEIPFSKAAEIGTTKVIEDHSTIGIVLTADETILDISRDAYEDAEKKAVLGLSKQSKPYIVILNTKRPKSNEAITEAKRMREAYGVPVLPLNVMTMDMKDINGIMEEILMEFQVSRITFNMPAWLKLIDREHPVKKELLSLARNGIEGFIHIRDAAEYKDNDAEHEYVSKVEKDSIDLSTGEVNFKFILKDNCYYDIISELTGLKIGNEYELVEELKILSNNRGEAEKFNDAIADVKLMGYGVMTPDVDSVTISEPELIRHGNKYGIRINASSPSVHLINAVIETEIAPIVGTKEQADDLIEYINKGREADPEGYWDMNIFGKSIRQLVEEGMRTKIDKINKETKEKMQQTLQKLVNESSGGVICIII